MRRHLPHLFNGSWKRSSVTAAENAEVAIVQLDKATFYRNHPSPSEKSAADNSPMFQNLTFSIPSSPSPQEHWAVIGPSNAGKTTFLEILRGQYTCIPPTARSYPYLSYPNAKLRSPGPRSPLRAIQYVGFNGQGEGFGQSGLRGAYMSARYESRKEETDFSVLDYLVGNTELNPFQNISQDIPSSSDLEQVVNDLKLNELIRMPVGNLSNGQTRRARIAKALLGKPELLLLDEPFMGLDPATQARLSPLLHGLAQASSPRLVLALRPQDPIPTWITHVIHLDPNLHVDSQGSKDNFLSKKIGAGTPTPEIEQAVADKDAIPTGSRVSAAGEPIVQMENVVVTYGDKPILGAWSERAEGTERVPREGLHWTVRRGERWGVFGPNGSGKTTLISLICSDHPQAYALPIKMFGRDRLPRPGQAGISIFDIQERIGHSSPEIHAFFPRYLTLRQTIASAWADTFIGTPKIDHQKKVIIESILWWFEAELNPNSTISGEDTELATTKVWMNTKWADELCFRDVSFSSQRVALFLRAVVKKPELVVLDEAFSGMDEIVRNKCMTFLTSGNRRVRENASVVLEPDESLRTQISGLTNNQALICVSHLKEEVPDAVREWMCLPEAGEGIPARFGRFDSPLNADEVRWNQIWGM